MALGAEPVRFNRDVRPILSENCFECHGPDAVKRKADLRLDAGALGQALIVAGNPDESELFQRIIHADPDERMPPADFGRALTSLPKWRRSVAGSSRALSGKSIGRSSLLNDRQCWRPTTPLGKGATIDQFVLTKLHESGLLPSPEADRETLLRR